MLLVVLLSILRTIVEYTKDDREKQITKTIHTIVQNPQGQKETRPNMKVITIFIGPSPSCCGTQHYSAKVRFLKAMYKV